MVCNFTARARRVVLPARPVVRQHRSVPLLRRRRRRRYAAAGAVALLLLASLIVVHHYTATGCRPQAVQAFTADFGVNGVDQYTAFHRRDQMKLVDDPAEPGHRVLSMTARSTDIGPTPNPRVQMAIPDSPLTMCTEFWASVSVYIPALSDADAAEMARNNGHVLLAQVYGQPYAGPAPLRMGWNHDPVTGDPVIGVGAVTADPSDPQTMDLWRTPLVTDRWITLAVHMLMSPDPDEGYARVWADLGDGNGLVPRDLVDGSDTYHYATLNMANDDPTGNTMMLDNYWPARVGVDEVTVLFRDHALGNSLDEVRPGERRS